MRFKKILSALALLCLPLAAQAQSGAAKVGGGTGFGCTPGMTYTVVDGMARCTMPQTAAPTGASCAANANYTKGACSYSVVGAAHGGSVSAPDKTAGYSGLVSLTCNNGSWAENSATCNPDPCSATSTTAGACTYSVPGTASGATVAGSLSSAPAGYTGSITGTCNLGAWSFGGASCDPPLPLDCGATTLSSGACTYPVAATAHGTSQTAATNTVGYTGSVTGTCTNGSWSQSGATCAPIPPVPADCSATVLSYGVCTYPVAATLHGASKTAVTNTPSYLGSITGTCSNGTWSQSSPTCNFDLPPPAKLPCNSTTLTYGAGCASDLPGIAHATSATVANKNGGYTGGITGYCTNGSWSAGGETCTPIPPGDCGATTLSSGMCSYNVPATLHGVSKTVGDSTAGYTGSITGTCTNGTWTQSGASCTQDPLPCGATAADWNGCTYPLPAIAHGASTTSINNVPGYTGGLNASCNNATWTLSGATCVPKKNCAQKKVSDSSGICSYWLSATTHGGTDTASNIIPNYSGSISGSCNDGVWNLFNETCAFDGAPPPVVVPESIGGYFCSGVDYIVWYSPSGRQEVSAANSPGCGYVGPVVAAETVGGYFCSGFDRIVWYTPTNRQALDKANSALCGAPPEPKETATTVCMGWMNWDAWTVYSPSGRMEPGPWAAKKACCTANWQVWDATIGSGQCWTDGQS